ncbi:MAG: FkbM family methyltransferase [Rhodanobacteraceae bacterium]
MSTWNMHPTASRLLKKVLGINPQSGVRPLHDMRRLGSRWHHYQVPEHLIGPGSICYCIGAGEDISFDTELTTIYGCKVYIFDPTPCGIDYFSKLQEYTAKGQSLIIDEGQGHLYTYRISSGQLATIEYVPIGVWEKKTALVFHHSERPNYASYSTYFFSDSEKVIEAPVDRLVNLMKERGHRAIDLVKLEIEGAEYTVIDTIIDDRLDIKVILVEFDEIYNSRGIRHHYRIKRYSNKLIEAGYVLVHSNDCLKRTFVRKDVYAKLKALEQE